MKKVLILAVLVVAVGVAAFVWTRRQPVQSSLLVLHGRASTQSRNSVRPIWSGPAAIPSSRIVPNGAEGAWSSAKSTGGAPAGAAVGSRYEICGVVPREGRLSRPRAVARSLCAGGHFTAPAVRAASCFVRVGRGGFIQGECIAKPRNLG